ncbi:5' nucleotidase, NT5C type [Marinomonas flavescens]|uniref:5' nucleotidase, NT5C type n=1 Tax=Marinomonas flavescens TaxID=2529379 RepID=UPI003B82F035
MFTASAQLKGAYDAVLEKNSQTLYPQSQYCFYANLEPMPDAIESVLGLIIFDPYILTAPSIYNPLCYTEKRVWVKKHFGIEFVSKLIISPNKGLLKEYCLIDDKREGRDRKNLMGN